tara:strand:- start:60 stop:452 length:393 start_codon:yes stop_codon:yes gene_type:complete
MIITIHTLVDITNTNVRKGPDIKLVKQQNNYDTFIQASQLRSNVEYISCECTVDEFNFGSANKGKNRYWTMKLKSDWPFQEEILIEDFDFLPIVTELDETGMIHNNIVHTKDSVYKNTIFLIEPDYINKV